MEIPRLASDILEDSYTTSNCFVLISFKPNEPLDLGTEGVVKTNWKKIGIEDDRVRKQRATFHDVWIFEKL